MSGDDALAVLQRIRRSRVTPQAGEERCELCGEAIAEEHGHVADLRSRNLLCACHGCYLLFTADGAGGGHYRAIPDEYKRWSGSQLSEADWDALQIPVGVAFFMVNSSLGRIVAFYPGPAGATESELPIDAWSGLAGELRPDVEALLVRVDPTRSRQECYVVPIDACYELVGRLRKLWRGFDGGSEAHAAIDAFFDKVEERAR
jgi:hypothetical protein